MPEWGVKFENYLSTIPGVNGMPLSYAVRDQVAPDRTTDFQGNFIAETIACAPLIGVHLQSYTRKVHQLPKNYLVDETAEQWISSIKKRANGRDNFDALRRYYISEGNVSRRFAMSDLLQETLHYKSRRVLSFSTLLDKMQKMFNFFRDEEGPMDNIKQVRELFRRVQHPQLQDTVKALEVRADLDGIAYSEAKNHLTSAVSKIPEYQFSQKVSVVKSSGGNSGGNKGGGGGPRKGGHNSSRIYNSQRKVHMGN